MFKRILVPLDGSQFAEGALPYAQMLARCGGGEIELLRVAVHPSNYIYVSDPGALADLYESDRAHCEDYLRRVAARVTAETGVPTVIAVREGVVADSILDYAEDTGADLIVMTTHGRTGMERWLLGSVAERVVRGAKMPVMLIRPNAILGAESATQAAKQKA
ncbi:MAG: universal stress protein [Anaerolineae bacterium]|nr:universal stress protein [Thermoflexales bacterium]MDW8396339.1 universal stress protein [Anaerolineae bacterium]